MVALIVTSYVLSAVAFYAYTAKHAPIMEEASAAPFLTVVEGGLAEAPLSRAA